MFSKGGVAVDAYLNNKSLLSEKGKKIFYH